MIKNTKVAVPKLDPLASFDEYNVTVRRRKHERRIAKLKRGRPKKEKLVKAKMAPHRLEHLLRVGRATRFKKGQFGSKSPRWKGGPLAKLGLEPDAYDKMFEAQNGLCAICKKPPKKQRLQIDHDHKTGRVRGLLCFRCNYGIGWFSDDLERLGRVAEYLTSKHDWRWEGI